MVADRVATLVIFGATGDLAKLETSPDAGRAGGTDALDVPVIEVAKSGWGLDQFRALRRGVIEAQGHGPRQPRPGRPAVPAGLRALGCITRGSPASSARRHVVAARHQHAALIGHEGSR